MFPDSHRQTSMTATKESTMSPTTPTKTLEVLTAIEYPDGTKIMVFTSRTEIIVKAIYDDADETGAKHEDTICHFPKLRYGQKPQSQYQKNLTYALCFAGLYYTELYTSDIDTAPTHACAKRATKIMGDESNTFSLINTCAMMTEKFLGDKTTELCSFTKPADDCAGWSGYIRLGINLITYDCHGQIWDTEEYTLSHKVSGRGKTMKSEHNQIELLDNLICRLYNDTQQAVSAQNRRLPGTLENYEAYEEIAAEAIESCGWHAGMNTLLDSIFKGSA